MFENHLKTRVFVVFNSVYNFVCTASELIEIYIIIMKLIVIFICACCFFDFGRTTPTSVKDAMDAEWNKLKSLLPVPIDPLKLNTVNQTYCTCGVFLSGQFKKGSNDPPTGLPALMHEQESMVSCNPIGAKQCSNKCLETVSACNYLQ